MLKHDNDLVLILLLNFKMLNKWKIVKLIIVFLLVMHLNSSHTFSWLISILKMLTEYSIYNDLKHFNCIGKNYICICSNTSVYLCY